MLKLKPGFLVTLSTRLEGGVRYRVLGKEITPLEGGAEVAHWETERTIADRAEHKAATNVRLHIRSLIRSCCAETPFGLICPADEEPKLDAKIAEAHQLAADWNAQAKHHKVQFSTLRGKIAESQAEAVQAITAEVKSLLESLDQVTRAGDVKGIRDVAMRATQMERLLEQQTSVRDAVGRAVAAGRKLARQIVKRVEQGADDLATVLAAANLSPIAQARFILDTPEADWPEEAAAVTALHPGPEPQIVGPDDPDFGAIVVPPYEKPALPSINPARFASLEPGLRCGGCGSELVTIYPDGHGACEDCGAEWSETAVETALTPAEAPEEAPA